MSDKMKAVVEINKLSKSFGKEKVLREISHSFETGRIHGIIGFNGSGKTVLFKCICGFLTGQRFCEGAWTENRKGD